MVKLFFNGKWYNTDNEKDNLRLKEYYDYSLSSRNNLIIALGLALIREENDKNEKT